MSEKLQKLRQEFLAETEQTLEKLQADVNRLRPRGAGAPDPEVVDRIFRTTHSLKGVSGMFGLDEMSAVSHSLENALDELRSETLPLDDSLLDLLHRGIEVLHALLARESGQEPANPGDAVADVVARIERHLRENATHRREEPAPDEDPWRAVMQRLAPEEREAVRDAARAGRDVALVEATLPEEGFEETFRTLLAAVRSWGTVHGSFAGERCGGSFRACVAASGTEGTFRLLKAVGPLGGSVVTVDRRSVLEEWDPVDSEGAAERSPATQPPAGGEPPERAPGVGSIPGTLRVPVDRVDRLLSELGDLLQAKMEVDNAAREVLENSVDRRHRTEFLQSLRHLDRRIRGLRDQLLRMRMVSLTPLFQKLERAVRETCRLTGKEARLVAVGEEVELDKSIVEALAGPLVHLVRNAVDHGMEAPQDRARAGKDPIGTVRVSARAQGSRTVVEVSDDGAGIDFEEILRAARQRGFVADDTTPSEAELRELLFRPGFTVREEATAISGRGVGLDVVREAMVGLGGALELRESPQGTTIRLRIPTTLAVMQALRVEAGGRPFFLPLTAVSRVLEIAPGDIRGSEDGEVFHDDGCPTPVLDLGAALGLRPGERDRERIPVVEVAIADRSLLLLVDRLGARREIVVRSLGPLLPPLPRIAGSTELGDGRTVLILDPGALLDPYARPASSGTTP